MNHKLLKMFALAKEISKLSNITKYDIGAVLITKKFEVIGVGTNGNKTHPEQAKFARLVGLPEKQFLHAELQCLVNAKQRNLHGASIVVYRESRDGLRALARPCPICIAALRHYGINKIYYTTPDGYASEFLS